MSIRSSRELPSPEHQASLLGAVSKASAACLQKPESVVMTSLTCSTMTFGGSAEPCCFIDVRQIGDPPLEARTTLTKSLTELVSQGLDVPANRIFIAYRPVAKSHWGMDGRLFG